MSIDYKQKIIHTFNQFNGSNIQSLNDFYSSNIIFSDPAHQIQGLDNLKNYYQRLYKNVESIHFDFKRFIQEGPILSGEWTMKLQVRQLNGGKPFEVQGASFFEFNADHLVVIHRDYFDLGAMLYEKIPGLGHLIKVIRLRL